MTAPPPATFAVPGDIATRTGGYIYERNLLAALRGAGRAVAHLPLGASFPDPSESDMADALARLAALPADRPVILDGFLVGALETGGLARVAAPICAIVHHPLGLETGLDPARAAMLLAREAANLALAAHVVVPSPHTAAILEADFAVPAGRITVAPPGFARPGVSGAAEQDDPPLILAVGVLAERKGHDVLLRALAEIADLPWRAEIVGMTHDPRVADALTALRAALGLAGRVRFAGSLGAGALQALYRRARLFALATRYEGYGLVFGEAMLHGLPVVACRTGAVPDTVPEGAGLLVPPDDPAAFAAALRRLLTEPALRRATAGGAKAAGAALPGWADTAAVVSAVLDRITPPGAA